MLHRRMVLWMVMVLSVAATVPAARADTPPLIALQAGHWRAEEQPEDFAWLRTSTGATAGGVREVDLNVDVAHRAAEYLRSWGNEAFVLPATVPPGYRADVFVSIHADGHANRT
ncbi:MAG TPA: hypothetical protein VEZ12_07870, partial [Herpetosiphonaceae bacterium]|nr:hypothetical protein [Herpetosiphonaceae bacterium]